MLRKTYRARRDLFAILAVVVRMRALARDPLPDALGLGGQGGFA